MLNNSQPTHYIYLLQLVLLQTVQIRYTDVTSEYCPHTLLQKVAKTLNTIHSKPLLPLISPFLK